MLPVRAILIGAGQRGRNVFARYAAQHPERLRIVGLAERDAQRRELLARSAALPAESLSPDWRPLLGSLRGAADAVIVATSDTEHVEPALGALAAGYDVLLEKPMAPTLGECQQLVRAAEASGRILQIAHVLRYSAFYQRIAELLHGGAIGRLLTLDLREHVAHWHMCHSYVRGKFRNRRIAAPIVLAKSCHDLDLMVWLVGDTALRLSSFGKLAHYREESAPAGAPLRCTDGCPVQPECPHDAVRFYLDPDEEIARSWPWSDVSPDPSREARRRALESGRYGRCVYHCDNDVPDHQTVSVEFAGGTLATFVLHGHATHETRTIRASGSLGELRGRLHDGRIELTRHGELEAQHFDLDSSPLGHFGGDTGLLEHFCDTVSGGEAAAVRTSAAASLESHLLGFASEQARESGRVIDLAALRGA